MWSYYGAKSNVIRLYPPPKYGNIIEPFCGTARYSCLYWDREIILNDSYEVITGIWKWLQTCSKNDVLKMPHSFKRGERIDNMTFDCKEAKWLIGFLIGKGVERPRSKVVDRITMFRPNAIKFQLQRIAGNLDKIRHWKIIEGDYADLTNEEATWFIDPPYQFGGHTYVKNKIDFDALAPWCRSRAGQVIVCENTKADWMNFLPIKQQKGSVAKTTEAIWTNHETSYNTKQFDLFVA